jgi:hypothetical protein
LHAALLALLSTLERCRHCGDPATHWEADLEHKRRLFWCDVHARASDPDGDFTHPLPNSEAVRQAVDALRGDFGPDDGRDGIPWADPPKGET